MMAGTQRKCSFSITALCEHYLEEVVEGAIRRHLRSVGWYLVLRNRFIKLRTFSSSRPTPSGDTCLSSPTTSTFFARRREGNAVRSDCDASSMTTRSKQPKLRGQ